MSVTERICVHSRSSSSSDSQSIDSRPITRISLTDSCRDGHIQWSPLTKDSSHIVQFAKNHEPFVLCFHNGTNLSLTHLKGSSQRQIKTQDSSNDMVCVRSHCNHLTLLLTSRLIPLRSTPHRVSYSPLADNSM